MTYRENSQITFGDVMSGTAACIKENWRVELIYVGAVGAMNAAATGLATVSPVLMSTFSVVSLFAGFAAQYLLFRTMILRAGLMGGDGR